MSLSSALFGSDSFIHKATNILGLGIPGWLDKQFGAKEAEPQIRTLGELSQQTAKEAEPRPIVWGRVRPIGGNIIHCQAPVTRMITTSVESSGGKGGSKKKKQKQTTQHVYRTYAIGVCEGPITGYTRIWRNNKLVYDGRGTAWGAANNAVFLKQFRLYLGGWSQLPDPTLEAIWGVGNVPAYRGTAYIVSIDEDLTDLAGSVPQFIFEVERAEYIASTSTPYGLLGRDNVKVGNSRPYNVGIRNAIHRSDQFEHIGSSLPTPGSVSVWDTTHYRNYSESLTAGLPTPNNVSIIDVTIKSSQRQVLNVSLPTPNNVNVVRVTIRSSQHQVLNVGPPTPSSVSVVTA